jgi:hypothetical protein
LYLKTITSPLAIVDALHNIFRIKPTRIKVLTSNSDLAKINSNSNLTNTLDYPYQIVIVPDATNDDPSPL